MNGPHTQYLDTGKIRISIKLLLISFVVGALVGTTGDFVHVTTKTDGYPVPGPFPFIPFLPVSMPVWVPFLFGSAVLLMAVTHKMCAGVYTPRMASNRNLAYASPVIFVLVYAMTGYIQAGDGSWQDIWLVVLTLAIWWWADRTFWGAAFAILNAICGTAFEIFLVHVHGFFYYPDHSNFFGVPSWLPWLYNIASICISLMVRWID
jgi:hypothetical protein